MRVCKEKGSSRPEWIPSLAMNKLEDDRVKYTRNVAALARMVSKEMKTETNVQMIPNLKIYKVTFKMSNENNSK